MDIPTFRRGDKLMATDMQSLADNARANRILPGAGIRVRQSPNGVTISVVPKRGGAPSSSSPFFPWEIYSFVGQGTPDSAGIFNSYKALVWPATVDGVLPDNMYDEFAVSGGNNTAFFKCKTTFSQGSLQTARIVVESTPGAAPKTLKGSPPTEGEFVFAIAKNGAVYQIVTDVIHTQIIERFRVPLTPLVVGGLVYEYYYSILFT